MLRRNKRILQLFCFIFACFAGIAVAHSDDTNTGKFIQYLAQEKINLTIANNQAKLSLKQNENMANLAELKQQNQSMLLLVRGKMEVLESFLANQRKQQQNLLSRLKKIQQTPFGNIDGMAVQEQISKINTLNDTNNKTIELIEDNLELANRYQALLFDSRRQLDIWQAKRDEQQQLDDLNNKILILGHELEQLYGHNLELQQEKKLDPTLKSSVSNDTRLLLNNQDAILIQTQIAEFELKKKQVKADYAIIRNQDIKTLQSVADTYVNALNQTMGMENTLKKMQALLQSEQLLEHEAGLDPQYTRIRQTITSRLLQLAQQKQNLQKALLNKQQQLKKQLSLRQSLAEYHLESWPSIFNQLLMIPAKFYGYLKSLLFKVTDNYVWQELKTVALFWFSVVSILVGAFALNRLLKWLIRAKDRSRLTAHVFDGFLILLCRNIPQLTFLSLIIMTLVVNHLAFASFHLLINLILVWLIFRNLILVARMVLLERLSDDSGQDVKLYYRLKWLFLVGGWTTALMVFSQQLPLSLLLQDIFNRLFMLFLLAVSWVLWKSKDIIPYLLRSFLRTKKRYVRNAVSLFTIIVPLILLTTAVIGLIGYIHLAWTLSRYQAYLLLLITGFVFARGLIFDALELLSEWMISSLRNGWLWIEVILKPLDMILRVGLLIVSVVILFQVFGWSSDALIMANIDKLAHYPLVDLSGIHITLLSILNFIILVCIFTWASKWTREFCFRWLYRNTVDSGIRNSLSVFTQYGVILMGGFITLRALGLDFSGMSMILGGLAVGMGFGLRDFASNIVGGFMLLIERPVREGDLITLGEYEGRVAHIGIRSMRVSSWDNMEVLIPNAETFNKPFTNWTHQDSIVRTVVPIKVSRADDPTMVQQLILDVLAIIPEILAEPAPQVFLKQIDEALIEFEIRYFINVQLYTRFEIRSKVLFAINAQFKAAGVQPPIPPISVELKSTPTDVVEPVRER